MTDEKVRINEAEKYVALDEKLEEVLSRTYIDGDVFRQLMENILSETSGLACPLQKEEVS